MLPFLPVFSRIPLTDADLQSQVSDDVASMDMWRKRDVTFGNEFGVIDAYLLGVFDRVLGDLQNDGVTPPVA